MKRKEKDAIIGTQVIRRISSYVKDHASKKRKEKIAVTTSARAEKVAIIAVTQS